VEDFILSHERDLYTVVYFAGIATIAIWEAFKPRRDLTRSLKTRWFGNFGVGIVDIAVIHLIMPFAAVGFALWVADRGIGLFNMVEAPFWLAAVISFLILDFGRYMHHWLLHNLSVLWRVHRVHHADHDYDFTVGIRFHPLEGLFTTCFGFVVIALLGAPPVVVAFSEMVVAISGLFVHANARTWNWVERYVRWVLVTPDMHRVHHSTELGEQWSNYSAVLSIWDRLLGSYIPEPAAGQLGMAIGLGTQDRDPEQLRLGWMLKAPFMRQKPVLVAVEEGTDGADLTDAG
jgi:sterol desaturase/sphingolipid hydroxylase (fatty acid hydroxylase superfamily)